MLRNYKKILTLTASAIVISATSTTVLAQDEAGARGRVTDVITVTARKKEETAQDAPLAVSAISGAQLDRAGIDSFDQVLNIIPNTSQPGGIAGGLQGLISIRGISTLVRFVGLETGVGFYVDGVYVGRPESFNQDLIDIERIEVLRGPQGAVFGKNTIAGAINIITQTPDNELRARAEVQYGNFNLVKFRGNISGPLIKDRLYASVSGGITRRDGFVKNAFPGGVDLDDADLSSFRGKLRFTPNDRAEFILSGDLLVDRGNAAFFEVSDVSFLADPSETTPFTVNADQPNFLNRDIYGLSLTSNIDIGAGVWTTVLGYRNTSFDAQLDDDKLPVRFFADAFSSDSDFFSAETRYAAPLGDRIDYVIGAYYFTQNASNLSNFALGDFLTGFPGVEPPLDLTSSVETDSFAFFVNADIAITDRLSLELGGRYINERKDAIHNQVDGTGLFGNVLFDISRRDTDFSPTVSLSYDLADTSMVYARFAQGFKSAGFNTDIISAAANQQVNPESATSYEVGYKATWLDNRLNTNAAIFYTTYDNLQVATITSAAVSLENAAQAEIFGVEFDFAAALGEYFDLNGSVGYLDATYDDFAGCPAGGAIAITPLANCAGNFLNNAPEFTAAFGAQFTYPTNGALGDFVMRADWNYRSEIFFEPQNETRLSGDSRNLLNVRAGFAADHWEIFGWARNITNETYVNFADDRSAIFVNTTQAFGSPRTYGVTLRFKY
ncbi:TonB-dependent receptor [hydrothermal vent metagenome]|uniref:TonB-dependent receptor n=1 Tax=hydrothermal vent metagenome TaxID=652676 RepID=A0A3B0SKF5_9ZZZZ